jgi:hypothetical protein
MFEQFQQLPNKYQGMFYFMAGLIMLLYALGIIERGITLIIVVFALYLISIGCVKIGLYQKAVNTMAQIKDQTKE